MNRLRLMENLKAKDVKREGKGGKPAKTVTFKTALLRVKGYLSTPFARLKGHRPLFDEIFLFSS